MEEKTRSSNALEWMYNEFIGNDPESIASYEEERVKAQIAREVYDLREAARLSQQQLADLVRTTAAVIDDLEEADYDGDALSMLVRIASLLNKKIDVRFVTSDARKSSEAQV